MAEITSNDLAVIRDFMTACTTVNNELAGELHFNCILQDGIGGEVAGRIDWNENGDVVFIPPESD
jgi:hypothetical protein